MFTLEDLARFWQQHYMSDLYGARHTNAADPLMLLNPTGNDTQGQLWHQYAIPNYNQAPMPHQFEVGAPQQTDGANYGDPRMSRPPALERGYNVRPGYNNQLYRDFPDQYDADMKYR